MKFNAFKKQCEIFFNNEQWQNLIVLCDNAKSRLSKVENVFVSLQIAHAKFYLGKYDDMKKDLDSASALMNDESVKNAESILEYKVEYNYLYSALYRKYASHCKIEPDKTNFIIEAENYINSALNLVNNLTNNLLSAVVYFNALAFYQDQKAKTKENNDKITTYYNNIISELNNDKSKRGTDLLSRTEIRYIRHLVDNNSVEPGKALEKLALLKIEPDSKTMVHFNLLKSKMLIKNNNYEEAAKLVDATLKITDKKNMKDEKQALCNLLEELNNKGFNFKTIMVTHKNIVNHM